MGVNERNKVRMIGDEIAEFLLEGRTGHLATIGPTGTPHLVAMWYAVVEGDVWIESKKRSQKIANLRRDGRISFLVESGLTYETLRGVSLEGQGHMSEERGDLWKVGVNLFERYVGDYSEILQPEIESMIYNRVAVRIEVERTRSWDHRKLSLVNESVAGSTAKSASSPSPSVVRKSQDC